MTSWTLTVVGLAAIAAAAETAPSVAFGEALDRAAVVQDRLDGAGARAMLVGNGDLLALVYADGRDLVLRLSKTDVWDARIDTSADPELPVIDVAAHTAKGSSKPGSWEAHKYPCGVPFARLRLAGAAGADLKATLDLRRATARVEAAGASTEVRAYSEANVLLVDSATPAELAGDPFDFLPAAELGAEGEVRWLRQIFPGDADYAGLSVVVAVAGAGGRQVVAAVTSREAADPRTAAVDLARGTLAADHAQQIARHEAWWQGFWSRSGVELSVPEFERWWYRQVYYLGCWSRPGKIAVGLKAGLDGLAGWHNSYKFNYNTQQTYFSPGPTNHPELAEPIIDQVNAYLPRARWLAKTVFGCEGAFVHSDVWPYEPDPAACRSRNQRQLAYLPWGFSLGIDGMIATTLWERYLYQPDRDYLASSIYPFLREAALFYCSFMDKCRRDGAGKVVLGPSFYPEQGSFGQDNTSWDIAYVTYALRAARQAAGILGRDADLVRRIEANLAVMPPYPTVADPGQANQPVVAQWLGAPLREDNHCSCVQPVFPGAQVTWFSPAEQKALFERTIRYQYEHSHKANPVVMVNISRARLSMTDDVVRDTLTWFRGKEQPNGLFYWEGHGTFISEQAAVARLITELLLQSVGGTIRVFPAWPADQSARFADLRAEGGFLVDAAIARGQVTALAVTSTAGGRLRLLDPWTQAVVERDTRPGERVVFQP